MNDAANPMCEDSEAADDGRDTGPAVSDEADPCRWARRAASVFDEVDEDGSGRISIAEINVWWTRHQLSAAEGSLGDRLRRNFEKRWEAADADGTGDLDVAQLATILQNIPEAQWLETFEPVLTPTFDDWHGQSIGALLCAEEGDPSPLARWILRGAALYGFFFLLFGWDGMALWRLFGCRTGFAESDHGEHGCSGHKSMMNLAFRFGVLSYFFAGFTAFQSLCRVYRPPSLCTLGVGGELAMLGAGQKCIPRSNFKSLCLWERAFHIMANAMGVSGFALATVAAFWFEQPCWFIFGVAWALNCTVTAAWDRSRRLAAALAMAHVEGLASAVRSAAEQKHALSDECWKKTVELPSIDLTKNVLPVLSAGWGYSLVCVSAGWMALGVVFSAQLYGLPGLSRILMDEVSFMGFVIVLIWCLLHVLAIGLLVAPFTFAAELASISTKCSVLVCSLEGLRLKDPQRVFLRIASLLAFVSPPSGIGVVVNIFGFSRVLHKTYLKRLLFTTYALISACVPILLAVEGEMGKSLDTNLVCENGWLGADGQCFKAFGASVADRKTWSGAEAACQALDLDARVHLATIHTHEQNKAVVALVKKASASADKAYWEDEAWIGLNDRIKEGEWTWANGEPLHYTAWKPGEPNNHWHADDCIDDTQRDGTTAGGEDHAQLIGDRWVDSPEVLVDTAALSDNGRRANNFLPPAKTPGCLVHRLKYVCSKPATQGALTPGINMMTLMRPNWVLSTVIVQRTIRIAA